MIGTKQRIEKNKNVFSMAVEKKSQAEEISLLEALSATMEECQIEPQSTAKLVNRSLKEKLEKEAIERNLIKGKDSPSLDGI